MKKFLIISTIWVINLFLFVGLFNLNEYCSDIFIGTRQAKCEVLEKYPSQSTGKYSHAEFILILKENNRTFDMRVSPSTFYEAKIGDIITFDINTNLDGRVKVTVIGILQYIILFIIFLAMVISSVTILFLPIILANWVINS